MQNMLLRALNTGSHGRHDLHSSHSCPDTWRHKARIAPARSCVAFRLAFCIARYLLTYPDSPVNLLLASFQIIKYKNPIVIMALGLISVPFSAINFNNSSIISPSFLRQTNRGTPYASRPSITEDSYRQLYVRFSYFSRRWFTCPAQYSPGR